MIARITDMHDKEVICISDGTRLGYVDDVEVDTCTAQIVSIVIYGHRLCGIFRREPDIVIHWKDIEVIGEETILVNHTMPCCEPRKCKKRGGIMDGIFGGR